MTESGLLQRPSSASLRTALPSSLGAAERAALGGLRIQHGSPSDMTVFLRDLEAGVPLDALARVVVAESGGEVVGWSLAELWTSSAGRPRALMSVFVREDCRGRGLGTSLAVAADRALPEVTDLRPTLSADPSFWRRALPHRFAARSA